ncbi:MAG: hypothetical protein QF721_10570 [Verrucomicrobiota bacterium]|jgi:hypothetical protein|nr:hypothetical protein [Verrucomicrobiota bacterium]MDP7049886.1 hypothetical protein [Verrucomicrobiota bacterium]
MRGNSERVIAAFWLALSIGQPATALCQARTVYHTGFEAKQDFDIEFTLMGQGGWQGEGTGGNGLVEDNFEGMGQQAYLGYWPAEEVDETYTSLWQPVKGIGPEETRITVTVLLMFVDSTNGHRDDFRWTLYNDNVQRLVTLDFDNVTRNINYALDDDLFLPTGYSFEYEALYDLKFVMDFAANTWTVSVGDEDIVSKKKLTTKGSSLAFGDIGPTWVYRDPENPGNNYLVFDDYQVMTERSTPLPPSPPTLEWTGWVEDGGALLRLDGSDESGYIVEYSGDLVNWHILEAAKPGDTGAEIEDIDAPDDEQRFYRARTAD